MRLYVSSIVVFAGAVALGSISGPAMTAEFLLPSARARRPASSTQRPAPSAQRPAPRPDPDAHRPAPSARRPASSAKYEYTQVHMGVPVRIVLYAGDRGFAESAARAAFARIAQLDRMMSDYRPDSELRQIEEHAGEPVRVSAELFDVVSRASEIARATGGAFDPTVAPLVRLWREARVNRRLPDGAALERARTAVGWRRLELYPSTSSIRLQPGMRLDLGGIAKGYILQEALKTMGGADVTRVMVEAGGDLVVGEPPPGRPGWHIATPEADLDFARRASALKNAALATSGPTAQFVEIDGVRYSHVVDPRTGMALTSDVVAYVIAADGATADALATALTVLGKEAAGTVIPRFPDAISSIFSRYSASGPSRVEKSAKRGQAP